MIPPFYSKYICLCLFLLGASCYSQTIAEKKASFLEPQKTVDPEFHDQLLLVNDLLAEKRALLKELYQQGQECFKARLEPTYYQELVEKIRIVKEEIRHLNEMWRGEIVKGEEYALWHQSQITISQLLMDYATHEHAYLIPPEIGNLTVTINSNIPIPRESWDDCLALILSQNGIGVRELNPYLHELYLFKNEPSQITCITHDRNDLNLIHDLQRLCFILSPYGLDPLTSFNFLRKFSNPNSTTLELVRGDIFIVSTAKAIKELLGLYEVIKKGHLSQEYQLVALSKVDAFEMQNILSSAFPPSPAGDGLRFIPLTGEAMSLFLFGSKDEIEKAVKLIHDVESQIQDARAKTIFWYTAKHSDAEDLASVLAKVYDLLVDLPSPEAGEVETLIQKIEIEQAPTPTPSSSLVVQPKEIEPLSSNRSSHQTSDGKNNFIVDPKTGSIIMVVEENALCKIKELLKKLDVPKKMVQIEVLLFEKKITSQNRSGLNLLKLGSQVASQVGGADLTWNSTGAGILEFLISRNKTSGIPAFDMTYHFLLSQQDIQINACPSVTTVNQTPATIAIVEEISINTGMEDKKERSTNNYARAQYGITIQITPTINMGGQYEEGLDGTNYITLDTDITFDTTKKSENDRPPVTRRHIKNHVRIADGQTVILGGLRRKNSEDSKESIPFLGEIPGIGKLFSNTDMYDSNTEMFVFITPKIISDPIEDAARIKQEELKKRPGDLPEFMCHLLEARKKEKKRLFERSLTALFGRDEAPSAPLNANIKEYDGR